jgi:hypothetical protein
MSRARLGVLAIAVVAGCGGARQQPSADATTAPPVVAANLGPHPFEWFFQPGRTALLEGHDGQRLLVAVEAVRKVGRGRAARLTWTLGSGAGKAMHPLAPSAIGLTDKGLHLLDAALDDAELAAELDEETPYAATVKTVPEQRRLDGRYVWVFRARADAPPEVVVCLGEGPGPTAEPCEDVCFAELCVSSTTGVVALAGLWAPNYETFSAPGYAQLASRFESVLVE